jgi:transposase
LDVATHQLTERIRIDASMPDYRRLLTWAKRSTNGSGRWRTPRAWARHLAQWLLSRGQTVLDVPATATARVRELSRGRRKTDTLDAAAAASVAALHGDARPVSAEGAATVLRMLDEHRTNLTRQRTRTVNQLHALLRELLPGGAPTDLTAARAAALLTQIRPNSPVERARKDLARELVDDVRRLDAASRRTRPAWPRSSPPATAN